MKEFMKKYTMFIHILLIIFIVLLEILLFFIYKKVFGASYDWVNQSVPFYEYLRNLFYETGKIFPNFAPHIGAGQNIYYFVYYGLFSPSLFLSYLFPFIRSGDFMMIMSLLSSTSSVILFYIFMIKNGYSKKMSLLISLIFLFNGALFARNFIHIMMIQYMPFLILGLFGTKKYLDEGKSVLLVISIVLIITTSYYFSIPAIICLCLYALYYYVKINDGVKFKMIFKTGMKYVLRIFLGIIIASFLLFPVIFTILNGRTTIKNFITFSSFIPRFRTDFILYSSYGLGFTIIVLMALIYSLLYTKKANRILTIGLCFIIFFPIFNLILNGMLYEHSKVLIPFIPLFLILIIEMIRNIRKIQKKQFIISMIIFILFSLFFVDNYYFKEFGFVYLDLLVTCLCLCLFYKKKKIFYIMPILVISLGISWNEMKNASVMPVGYYNSYYSKMENDTSDYLNVNTNSIYRYQDNLEMSVLNYSDAISQYKASIYSSTSNGIYNELIYKDFNNNYRHPNLFYLNPYNNLFFNKFMGIRYLSSYDKPPYGYYPVEDYNSDTLFENKNVYSIGFASSNLLSYDEYNELSFMEKLEAYIYNIIIDGKSNNSDLEFNYEKIDLDFEIKNSKKLKLEIKDGHYIIDSRLGYKLVLEMKEKINNKTLVIRFKVNTDLSCDKILGPTANLEITIENVSDITTCQPDPYHNYNKTFDYVISSNEVFDELEIKFLYGIYDIYDIEIYAIDNSFFDKNNTTPINIDFDKTKGDDIYGSIDVLEDGYFIFTIPYDKGYTAYLDGKEVEIEKVNNGFIGFKIDKGYHNIHLTFEAPYAKLGRIVSLVGIVILIGLIVYEKKITKKVI